MFLVLRRRGGRVVSVSVYGFAGCRFKSGGALFRRVDLEYVIRINSGLSSFRNQQISSSFDRHWLKTFVRLTAVWRLDAPRTVGQYVAKCEFAEFTLARGRRLRSYFAKRHTCVSVTQCKASSGLWGVSVRVVIEKRTLLNYKLFRNYSISACHGVTYYYFTYYCFVEYVCDYVMSTYINGHCPYCLLKRDGATRWTRCDNCERTTLVVGSNVWEESSREC